VARPIMEKYSSMEVLEQDPTTIELETIRIDYPSNLDILEIPQ